MPQLDWFNDTDRMLFFGIMLGISALVYLVLLIAEYNVEIQKRKKRR